MDLGVGGVIALILHVVCIFARRSGHVNFFCSVSEMDRAGWGRREDGWVGLGLDFGYGLDVMKSVGHRQLAEIQELQPDPSLEVDGGWWCKIFSV